MCSALARMGVGAATAPCAETPRILVFDGIGEAREMLRELVRDAPGRVLAIAAPGTSRSAAAPWTLLQVGASDVLGWQGDDGLVADLRSRIERWARIDAVVSSALVREHLVGSSAAWLALLRDVIELALFTDGSLLILGESGTGKELIARLVHTLDPRQPRKDLVLLDCAALVPELAGSEFFGHERGAYTGATGSREGVFELADRGALFLDEVGDLPLALQPQLLRVIQERTYKRVGGNTWQRADFRLICATHRELAAEVERGAFRHDLYHRISTSVVRTPPLRERTADILPLTRHFLAQLRAPDAPPELTPAVEAFLLGREYPGNVRELRQVVTRMTQRHVGSGPITVGDVAPEDRPSDLDAGAWRASELEPAIRRALARGVGLKEIGRAATDVAVQLVVDQEDGNLQRAARKLGVTDRALQLRRAPRHAQGPDEDPPAA